MKKVFLSLAAIAVLTVVSCKKTETEDVVSETADTTMVVDADTTMIAVDTTVTVDTTVVAPAN